MTRHIERGSSCSILCTGKASASNDVRYVQIMDDEKYASLVECEDCKTVFTSTYPSLNRFPKKECEPVVPAHVHTHDVLVDAKVDSLIKFTKNLESRLYDVESYLAGYRVPVDEDRL